MSGFDELTQALLAVATRLKEPPAPLVEYSDFQGVVETAFAPFDPIATAGHARLPDDYRQLLEWAPAGFRSDTMGGWDFVFFGVSDSFTLGLDARDDEEWRVAGNEVVQRNVRSYGMWLMIARLRDHHNVYVCVDRRRAEWGMVCHSSREDLWCELDFYLRPTHDLTLAWLESLLPKNER